MMPSRLPRVLIAEDDYLVSEMVKGLLSEMGYAVAGVASTGQEALSMTQQLQPDVVLMDIRMPDMDGIEATRLITQRYPTPVVMLTAYETPELVQASSEAGAGAFLVKPPNAAEIQRTVTIAMARCADLRKLRVLNAELQARNEELDAFAHTVAHDLKDLLARIVGFAEAVVDNLGTLAPHELETHLRTISQGGRKMGEIIDALLLLAGVHKIEVAVAPLNMAGIVASALQRLDSLVSERQATIVVPDLWPTAMGYEPWVEEVWYNYISNAVKYSGDPAQI
ncbi:MAG: response regulator, partial [Anaerolineales bacterium]|nr:response regulator [Anaerolineales bacterium]